MKQLAAIKSLGKSGVHVQINADIDRELTEGEEHLVSDCVSQIYSVLNKTNYINTPEFKQQVKDERRDLLACFPETIYVRVVDNEYGGYTPWFQVTTKLGRFVIGWRKRVIHIDWSDTDNKAFANDLFSGEDTTKFDHAIHAWGYEKAKEYINKILSS